jgi:hypothetical protein
MQNMNDPSARNRKMIWLVVGLLFVLHHDFWLWSNTSLVLGFLPIGLAYHLGFSIAAAGTWFAMIKFAWPSHVEEFADGKNPAAQPQDQQP